MKTVGFSETITACGLKLNYVNDDMCVLNVKVIFDLGQRSFTYENLTCFSQ